MTPTFLAKRFTCKYNKGMNKKNIMVLFILSFVCMVFTVNNLCYKAVDNRFDTVLIEKKYNSKDFSYINKQFADKKVVIISENSRLLIALGGSCLFFVMLIFFDSISAYLLMALFIIAYFIAYKLFLNNLIFINFAGPVISLFVTKYFADSYLYLFKGDMDKRIENALGKYISKDIKNKIMKNSANVELGGKRAEITVMFADIRGFTSLSENHKAEEVSKLLNEYFSELEPIITKHKGVINKFIGDAALVIFGDPSEDKEHAKNAVKCAGELRKKVKEIREKWISEGKPKIDIGVGINTGEAFIGNVGTINRFEYTAIGDTVNIASRIEDYNKIYKTHILISENTYSKISQIVDVIKIREVSIKGKTRKINIYEVLRITD